MAAGADDPQQLGVGHGQPHLHRDDAVLAPGVGRLAVKSAVCTMIQSVVWGVLSLLAVLVHVGVVPTSFDDPLAFPALLVNLYLKESTVFPEVSFGVGGLATPFFVFVLLAVMVCVNLVCLASSIALLAAFRGSAGRGAKKDARPWVLQWAFATGLVTVADLVLAVAMARDLVLAVRLQGADDFPEDLYSLPLCPLLMLVFALRVGVLLVANVYSMLKLMRSLSQTSDGTVSQAKSADRADREGPIDAFLYRNGERDTLGAYNPVFVPDDGAAPANWKWASFRPPEDQGREKQQQQAPDLKTAQEKEQHYRNSYGFNARQIRGFRKDTDEDDVAHLAWMEDVDRHLDVGLRSPGPRAPPQHRHGYLHVEEQQAQDRERRAPAALLPRPAAPAPAGYGPYGRRQPQPLPQPAYAYPAIPRPDYSPPQPRRATVRRGARGPWTSARKLVEPKPVPIPVPGQRPGNSNSSSRVLTLRGLEGDEEDA